VFRVLDYLSQWNQANQARANQSRGSTIINEEEVQRVTQVVESIPAEFISRRAIECKSYSRALFYWEQHMRDARKRTKTSADDTSLMERLQEIYTQIDEPDGIEGISAHLHVLDIDQIVLGHRKAGRWTAAQGWYEIKLAETPDDIDIQLNLLTCLKESGQHGAYLTYSKCKANNPSDVLLNYIEGMHTTTKTVSKLLPYATEASWATGRWSALEKYILMASEQTGEDFNVSIGTALLALHKKDTNGFASIVQSLRQRISRSLSASTTSSLGSFHDPMLKFHVLTELEMIAGTGTANNSKTVDMNNSRQQVLESLDRRLETLGAYLNDKQYLLGIRRAAMQLSA